jgi:hypothetical protein
MPAYVIERKIGVADAMGLPTYLVFSSIPGYRDTLLESVVNEVPDVLDWLSLLKRDDPEDAIRKRLQGLNVPKSSYAVVLDSIRGIEVVVNADTISTANEVTISDQINRLTVNNIGKYLLASDWCVWITCPDENIRRRAAVQQSLEWLQNSIATPQLGDIEKFIEIIDDRLSVKNPITKDELKVEAKRKKFFAAIDRLEVDLNN